MGRFDSLKARAFGAIERAPGRLGDAARRANDALGRPLATAAELDDRRAFQAGYRPATAGAVGAVGAGGAGGAGAAGAEAAPVIVYHLDKHTRDLARFTQVLDGAQVSYRVMNLEGDPATQAAVRRDSGGRKLPLVFIAGECVGGREELNAMDRTGALKQKIWGNP